jgi:hypothetical protein
MSAGTLADICAAILSYNAPLAPDCLEPPDKYDGPLSKNPSIAIPDRRMRRHDDQKPANADFLGPAC